MNNLWVRSSFSFILVCAIVGCHQQPHISVAASSTALTAPAPMGSETSQGEMQIGHQNLLNSKAFQSKSPLAQALGEAEYFFKARRFIESAKILSRLLDAHPTYPGARNLLARCFFFLGNLRRALDELDYIVVHQSQDLTELLDALYLQGAAVYGAENVSPANRQRAIRAWEMYIKIAHESPHKEKVKENLETLKSPSVSHGVPRSSKGSQNSAVAAFEAGDLIRAEKLFLEKTNKKPDVEALTYLGRIYVRLQRMDESHDTLMRAVKIDAAYVPGWHYLGMAKMMKQDTEGAVAAWEKVVEIDPVYADKHKLRDRILIAKGMGEAAKSAIQH